MPLLCMAGLKTNGWLWLIVVSFLNLKLSPTPGFQWIVVYSSNSTVASPLQAATKQFFLFLVVLAHGFDMMPQVHSEAFSSYIVGMLLTLRGLFFLVDMSLPVVHSVATSPLLPSSCRVHCPYLLLCLFYHGHSIFTGRMNSCHYVL
jgi:hypothetical protein